MARTTRKTRTTAGARRPAAARRQSGDLEQAVQRLLKAIPIDNLDRRLRDVEKLVTRLRSDVETALKRLATGATRARTTTKAASGTRATGTTTRRKSGTTTRRRTGATSTAANGRRRKGTTTGRRRKATTPTPEASMASVSEPVVTPMSGE